MTCHSFYDTRVTGTDDEKKLATRLARTFPGQASFADEARKEECRQCSHFGFKGYDGQRQIKQGKCSKFKVLTSGSPGPKFPGTAKACKYFEPGIDHPARTGQEGDYRQVNGPDHLWRETRRALREAEAKGHTPFDKQT